MEKKQTESRATDVGVLFYLLYSGKRCQFIKNVTVRNFFFLQHNVRRHGISSRLYKVTCLHLVWKLLLHQRDMVSKPITSWRKHFLFHGGRQCRVRIVQTARHCKTSHTNFSPCHFVCPSVWWFGRGPLFLPSKSKKIKILSSIIGSSFAAFRWRQEKHSFIWIIVLEGTANRLPLQNVQTISCSNHFRGSSGQRTFRP